MMHPDTNRDIGTIMTKARVVWTGDHAGRAGGRLQCGLVVAIRVRVAAGQITVSDEGPGIPEADIPYIFDRFYRSAAGRSQPGSGLGLAIVRQIAEAHGGTVTVQPQEHGACLRMSLRPLT